MTENNQVSLKIKSAQFGKHTKNRKYFLNFIKGIYLRKGQMPKKPEPTVEEEKEGIEIGK